MEKISAEINAKKWTLDTLVFPKGFNSHVRVGGKSTENAWKRKKYKLRLFLIKGVCCPFVQLPLIDSLELFKMDDGWDIQAGIHSRTRNCLNLVKGKPWFPVTSHQNQLHCIFSRWISLKFHNK